MHIKNIHTEHIERNVYIWLIFDIDIRTFGLILIYSRGRATRCTPGSMGSALQWDRHRGTTGAGAGGVRRWRGSRPGKRPHAGCAKLHGAAMKWLNGARRRNFRGLVLGCIEAKFCKKICVGKLSSRSTQCTPLHRSLISIFSSKIAKTFSRLN